MQLVMRLAVSLVLLVQPSLCWARGECAGARNQSVAVVHDCCCGNACPASAARDSGILAPCSCGADEGSQPPQPTKPVKERSIETAAFLQVVALPAVLPSRVLVLKPQKVQIVPVTRSINTILCVWPVSYTHLRAHETPEHL